MTDRLNQLRAAIRRPLPLAYHPLYRFYEGGALTRDFRGLPARPDDWWSEDWVGSCTYAGNADPDGRPGLGPGPRHDRLHRSRHGGHLRPGPAAAAGPADQPRLA